MVKMDQVKIYKELDLTSAGCAGPLGELNQVADDLKEGEAVKVILEGKEPKLLVESWAKKKGFKVLDVKEEGKKYVMLIAK